MKIKILKDEYLFSEQGFHICDESGFAIKATEDTEVEISERVDFVIDLITADRLNRGLSADGTPIPQPATEERSVIEEPIPPTFTPSVPEESAIE